MNQYDKQIRFILFLFCSTPAGILVTRILTNNLGINPFATISHTTAELALIFLLITLTITPIRRWLRFIATQFNLKYGKRLSDWNFLIKTRRQLGLFSFFYASLHFSSYLILDITWQWQFFVDDLKERSFIIYGLITLLLTFLLAITSAHRTRKLMGRWWRRLHRLMYILVPLAVAHYWLAAKHGDPWPQYSAAIVFCLLISRTYFKYHNKTLSSVEDGMLAYRTKK